jgi:hypothetical protein
VAGEVELVVLGVLAPSEVEWSKIEGVEMSLLVGLLVRISRILVWLGQMAMTKGRKSKLSTPTSSKEEARLSNEQHR